MESLNWLPNRQRGIVPRGRSATALVPSEVLKQVRGFHQQIADLHVTPLKRLRRLAEMLGVGGVWIKDESQRCDLRSFKVLGASYAMYQTMKKRLERSGEDVRLEDLARPYVQGSKGPLTFAAATDGNHGCGVAWMANSLGSWSRIYVPRDTSQQRIDAIEACGGEVTVIDGTYDESVDRVREDADRYGWEVIADTAWAGYQQIPRWVIQGYSTIFSEVQEQLAAMAVTKPSHVIVQAGVGSLAASAISFYRTLLGDEAPRFVIVEPRTAACIFESIRIGDGEPYRFEGDLTTIMAGLSCGRPNPLAWPVLQESADAFVSCSDSVAALGMRMYAVPLLGDPLIISGESGAVSLGVLSLIMQCAELAPLRDMLELDQDSQVLLVNTEGNTDPDSFRQIVWHGEYPSTRHVAVKHSQPRD